MMSHSTEIGKMSDRWCRLPRASLVTQFKGGGFKAPAKKTDPGVTSFAAPTKHNSLSSNDDRSHPAA